MGRAVGLDDSAVAVLPLQPGRPAASSGRFTKQKTPDNRWLITDTVHNKIVGTWYRDNTIDQVIAFLDKQIAAGHTFLTVGGPPDYTSRTTYCSACGETWACKCGEQTVRRRDKLEVAEIEHELMKLALAVKGTARDEITPSSCASKLMLPVDVCRSRLLALSKRGLLARDNGSMYSWGAMSTSEYKITQAGEDALAAGIL